MARYRVHETLRGYTAPYMMASNRSHRGVLRVYSAHLFWQPTRKREEVDARIAAGKVIATVDLYINDQQGSQSFNTGRSGLVVNNTTIIKQ